MPVLAGHILDANDPFQLLHPLHSSKAADCSQDNRSAHPEFRVEENTTSVSDVYRVRRGVDTAPLSIVQGFWDRDAWGPPFVQTVNGGAEVWALFSPKATDIAKSWSFFLEALSGQFCASLSHLGLRKNSFSLQWSYRPSGLSENFTSDNFAKYFRYGQLPHEELCTENFTPWAKLLPCKKLMGLASLLKPRSVFRARYNSLNIEAPDCQRLSVELRQSLSIVFDRRYLYADLAAPWSLAVLLGGRLKEACPVASRSQIIVLQSRPRLTLSPPALLLDSSAWDPRRVFAVYDSHKVANSLIVTSVESPGQQARELVTPVSLMKYATGKGDVSGGVRIVLRNKLDVPVKAALFDSAPWYTEVYYSSLNIACQDAAGRPIESCAADRVVFRPSVVRERMAVLEMLLTLPANSLITVSYNFKKILMRWNEYPPDANHGVYLPAASVVFQLSAERLKRLHQRQEPMYWETVLPMWAGTYADFFSPSNSSAADCRKRRVGDGLVRLYSEPVLVRLPVPDFSMPFNALCLVCSIVAVAFGSGHKAATNAMMPVVSVDGEDVDRPPLFRILASVRRRILAFISSRKDPKPHPKSE
ncbi:hypothetical protein SprV_0401418300 [Sparganum proliferum]